MTPCVVSKYEYKQHYGGAAKSRFLADQCKCEIQNGPPLRNGQKYKNPYTCEEYSCNCPSRPKLIKQTAWEFEFEPCHYGGVSRMFLDGPDHCKEVVRNCKPMMVERRDGSPCKLGPGEGFSGRG